MSVFSTFFLFQGAFLIVEIKRKRHRERAWVNEQTSERAGQRERKNKQDRDRQSDTGRKREKKREEEKQRKRENEREREGRKKKACVCMRECACSCVGVRESPTSVRVGETKLSGECARECGN